MWKIHTIYKITSIINGREYIGSAINFYNRKNIHLHKLKFNKHHSYKLQKHYNKYGKNDLFFSIIEVIMFPELLIQREQYWIDKLKPFFNICKIASSNLGKKATFETKEKLRISHLGHKHSEKTKIKIGLGAIGRNVGKKHSKEQIEMLRNIHLGSKHSEEHKRKISIANKNTYSKGRISATKGKHCSERTKIIISLTHKGKIVSEETRKKLSESLKNKKRKPMSEEAKIKLSNILKGRKRPKEVIDKIIKSRKLYYKSKKKRSPE